jgi:hypothetical protein
MRVQVKSLIGFLILSVKTSFNGLTCMHYLAQANNIKNNYYFTMSEDPIPKTPMTKTEVKYDPMYEHYGTLYPVLDINTKVIHPHISNFELVQPLLEEHSHHLTHLHINKCLRAIRLPWVCVTAIDSTHHTYNNHEFRVILTVKSSIKAIPATKIR